MADARRTRLADLAVPGALVAVTAATRLPRLDRPGVLVFDELYYVLDASDVLRHGVEQGPVVHPPLGKWLIASGIRVFGFDPMGWRLAVLAAGCLTVLVTYLAARQVVAGRALPALAAVAVAFDGVMFTTGRVALLDGFVALFVTSAVALVLAAYRHPDRPAWVARCRLGAAACVGLGLATKWGAVLALVAATVAFAALALATPSPRRKRARAVAVTVATFAAVPAVVYLGAYGPWLVNAGRTAEGLERCGGEPCPLGLVDRAGALADDQWRILTFHRQLRPRNRFAAPAWTWVAQSAPVVLFERTCAGADGLDVERAVGDGICSAGSGGRTALVVVVGNPAVWWAGLGGGVALAVRAVRRRDATARLLLGMGLALWLPWMATGREAFLFYAAPLVPVLALWLAAALARPRARRAAPVLAGLVVALAVVLYPVWSGVPLTPDDARFRQFWELW